MTIPSIPKNPEVDRILERFDQLKKLKQPWLPAFEVLGKYIRQRKRRHISDTIPGEILTSDVYDSTAPRALGKAAATLVGSLWPSASQSFELVPTRESGLMQDFLFSNEEEKAYAEQATAIMQTIFDQPEAGLLPALQEITEDALAFGTSGIYPREQEDNDVPVYFEPIDVKVAYIDEGKRKQIDTVYIKRAFTVRQIIQEFDPATLSQSVQAKIRDKQWEEKVNVLQAVEPRLFVNPQAIGNKAMPIAMMNVEIEARHMIDEGGFAEMPVFITRFEKALGEVWGRGPGIAAIPDIREINHLRQLFILATEKWIEPPIAYYQEAVLGNGVVNLSAGARLILNLNSRFGTNKPFELIDVVKDPTLVIERIRQLEEIITDAFFIDRLLDLNNQVQMTANETNVRNELRGQSLNLIYARQLSELYQPMIRRVFNILLRRGFLGVQSGSPQEASMLNAGISPLIIPDSLATKMQNGRFPLTIRFISPAARIMKMERSFGINNFTEYAIKTSTVFPEVLDNINIDETIRQVQDLTGAPAKILRADDEVERIRKGRAEAQQAQMQAAQMQQAAEAMRAGGQGLQAIAGAEGNE
jgi:hypothetical protein